MAEDTGITRRTVIGAGAAALATVAVFDLFHVSSVLAQTGSTAGVGYFSRFGVTEKLIRETLAAVDGNVSEAARRLGVSRNTLYRRLRQADRLT